MKIAAAVLAASAISLAVAGCSSNSSDTTTTTANSAKDKASAAMSSAASAVGGAMSSASAAVGSAASKAQGAVDSAKSTTFTVAFKAGFSNLAEGRDDAAIADIFNQTCADIDANQDESTIVTGLETRAGNNGVPATKDQAQHIYDIAKPLC
ncbi:hypothetical protein FK531_04045 [Rhodococcus spelaei]|uniref:Lipoprotein n=1 Tax=Rhodococcus spelaei TaxID=2546320 RepID=A0A541BNH2_9NOCA|nr:hypothetical protein [Rhodococcus spelaei]TQF73859.1 hypothetical protein FK531_04045 [Rhodococcus spelaei]